MLVVTRHCRRLQPWGPPWLRARSLRAYDRQGMPFATPMDQITHVRPSRTRRRPHAALVVASLILTVGLWFVIYAVSGRVIWFW